MTQEQKARAYDEAIERAREVIKNNPDFVRVTPQLMEEIFPELAEAEDSRISKEICDFICWATDRGCITKEQVEKSNSWLAWLEKQGDTNGTIDRDEFAQGVLRGAAINLITWIDYNAAEGNMCLSNMECKDIEDSLVSGDWGKIYAYLKKKLEKQDHPVLSNSSSIGKNEQKHDDKVEPKFHEGEWVANRFGDVWHIDSFDSKNYQVSNGDRHCYFPIEKQDEMHLWTIQDAKDGDTLACNEEILLFKSYSVQGRISLYCWYNVQTNNFHSKGVDDASLTTRNKICPATKEQHDLLFQKMKEAGYENWLKSLKDRVQPQPKQEWSKEDDVMIRDILGWLPVKSRPEYNQRRVDWLKSLKDGVQPTLAWNENDEVALESAATNYAQDKYLPVQTAQAFKAGARWVLTSLTTSSPDGQAPT